MVKIMNFQLCDPAKLKFVSQDDDKIDGSYDFEGDLMYYNLDFLRKEIAEDYDKAPIQDNNLPPQNLLPYSHHAIMDQGQHT